MLESSTGWIDKFPDLGESKIAVTLEMENSPAQAGPDLFKIKLHILRSRYHDIIMEKSDPNFYVALAKVSDQMLERLNRFGDRGRVKERKNARQIAREVEIKLNKKEIEIDDSDFQPYN